MAILLFENSATGPKENWAFLMEKPHSGLSGSG